MSGGEPKFVFAWIVSAWATWAITAPSGQVSRNCISLSDQDIAFISVSKGNT